MYNKMPLDWVSVLELLYKLTDHNLTCHERSRWEYNEAYTK